MHLILIDAEDGDNDKVDNEFNLIAIADDVGDGDHVEF